MRGSRCPLRLFGKSMAAPRAWLQSPSALRAYGTARVNRRAPNNAYKGGRPCGRAGPAHSQGDTYAHIHVATGSTALGACIRSALVDHHACMQAGQGQSCQQITIRHVRACAASIDALIRGLWDPCMACLEHQLWPTFITNEP